MGALGARLEELDDGGVEAHGHPITALDHQPGLALGPPPRPVRRIDVPRPTHAQVGVEDAAVVEAQQEVLAPRLDPADGPADQP